MNDDNVPVYGAKIQFKSSRKPDPIKYILWVDSVDLTDTDFLIHDSLNYDDYSNVITSKQHVALSHEEILLSFCTKFGIIVPLISALVETKSTNKKRKRCNTVSDALIYEVTPMIMIIWNIMQDFKR